MSNKSNKILQVANRKTSVEVTVEITKEIDNALDKVVEGLPKVEGIAVTKENVIVAATENYLEILRRIENKKSKAEELEKAEKNSPLANQKNPLDYDKVA